MWESIKNDPLLKAVTVILLGVLGFGFAFNVMFGRNNGGMEHGMSGGYSLDSTLGYIIALLVKLLLIAVLVIGIITVVRLARKYLFGGSEIKMFDSIKRDPVLKAASVIILVVLVFALVLPVLDGLFGMGSGYGYHYNYMSGFSLTGLLTVLVKLLLVISVLGLFAGIIAYVLQNYSKLDFGKQAKAAQCVSCGSELKTEWKCCPNCGNDIE